MSGAERRVRSAGVLAVVGGNHWHEDQSTLFVHPDVTSLLEVDRTIGLGPNDDGERGVGYHRALDTTHQAPRQVEPFGHREYSR